MYNNNNNNDDDEDSNQNHVFTFTGINILKVTGPAFFMYMKNIYIQGTSLCYL